MGAMLAHPVAADDRRSLASVDVRDLEETLIERTVELSRELPRGARPIEIRRLETDFTRRGQPTLSRWLRIALAAVKRGQDARLYGELVADVLGAAAAAVLPVSEASLAECLAESHANPLQVLADRPDASAETLRAAAKALDAEARAATAAARSYRRRARELCRVETLA